MTINGHQKQAAFDREIDRSLMALVVSVVAQLAALIPLFAAMQAMRAATARG